MGLICTSHIWRRNLCNLPVLRHAYPSIDITEALVFPRHGYFYRGPAYMLPHLIPARTLLKDCDTVGTFAGHACLGYCADCIVAQSKKPTIFAIVRAFIYRKMRVSDSEACVVILYTCILFVKKMKYFR